MGYGGSQARGPIRAIATSLYQSHSNARSKPKLQPTPQLMATLDPQPTEQDQGSNSCPQDASRMLTTKPQRELPTIEQGKVFHLGIQS